MSGLRGANDCEHRMVNKRNGSLPTSIQGCASTSLNTVKLNPITMHEKILLVDDHAMLLIGLRKQIESMEFSNITSGKSCNKLLEELKKNLKNPYSHLILDIGLWDGSSVETLQAIRSLIPIGMSWYTPEIRSPHFKSTRTRWYPAFLSKEEDALSNFAGSWTQRTFVEKMINQTRLPNFQPAGCKYYTMSFRALEQATLQQYWIWTEPPNEESCKKPKWKMFSDF